jgi:hypothetical protein
MRQRKPKPVPLPFGTEPFLARIRQGYVQDTGVLADFLKEQQHPLAVKVDGFYRSWLKNTEYYRRVDWSQSRSRVWSRFSAVGSWHRWLWKAMRKLFQRAWKLPKKREPDLFEWFNERNGG